MAQIGWENQCNLLQVSEERRRLRRIEGVLERRHPTVTAVDADGQLRATGHVRAAGQQRALGPVNEQLEVPIVLQVGETRTW